MLVTPHARWLSEMLLARILLLDQYDAKTRKSMTFESRERGHSPCNDEYAQSGDTNEVW